MSRLVDLDFFCFETRCPPWLHRDWRTISDICRQVCHQIHAFLAVIMWACRVRATSLMHRIVLLSWATTHAALSSCGQLLNHESGFMWLVQFEAVKAFRKGQKVAGWEGLCLFNTVYIYIYISLQSMAGALMAQVELSLIFQELRTQDSLPECRQNPPALASNILLGSPRPFVVWLL